MLCPKTLFATRVKLKDVLKTNNKAMCVFDSDGVKLFENDAYVTAFESFDMFGHVVGCRGTRGKNTWKSQVVRKQSSYDIHVMMQNLQ